MTYGMAPYGTVPYGVGELGESIPPTPPPPPAPAGYPSMSLQVAFFNNPQDPIGDMVWYDITDHFIEGNSRMGRQHELDRIEASTLNATLNNRDGVFAPWNTGSPYWSGPQTGYGLVPGKPVQWLIAGEPVYFGFVDAWKPDIQDHLNEEIQLSCSDVLKQLSLRYLLNNFLYPDQINPLNPQAWYRMNDTGPGSGLDDSSGNNNIANILGGLTYQQQGAVLYDTNCAIQFGSGNSATGMVETPKWGGAAGTTNWTFEFWVQVSQLGSSTIAQWPSGFAAGDFYIETLCIASDGVVVIKNGIQNNNVSNPVGGGTDVIGPYIGDGVFHHVVVTLANDLTTDAAQWSLYVDGVPYGTGDNTYTWGNTDYQPPMYIGGFYWADDTADTDGLEADLTGLLDEVAIYPTFLTLSQIQNNYTVGSYFQNIEYTGQRIAKCLIVAGYGNYPQNLDTGTILCLNEAESINDNTATQTSANGGGSGPVTQTTCLSYIQNAEDTENGIFYQDTSGIIQFRDRERPYTDANSTTVQQTFADNPSTPNNYVINGLEISQDDLDLWNDAQVQSTIGVLQVWDNFFSQDAFGYRSLQKTGLLFAYDSDANYLAQFLLFLYQWPLVRWPGMEVGAESNGGANQDYMCAAQLWDRVQQGHRGPNQTPLAGPALIEGIAHNFRANPGIWHTRFATSPQEAVGAEPGGFLILNSSTMGLLDTNVLGA